MMMMMVVEAERRRGNAVAGGFFHPFTPSQLQELHGQAVIFNCMSLGLPVPSHLLLSLGRSSRVSQPKQGFSPHHNAPLEWGCRQMGSSGREEDPEPGRCRRTDGKKWRCSRAACPDSKYCERHLHRGKNRSRKQMESSLLHPIATTSSPCSLSLLPPIIQSKRTAREDLRFCDGGKENGVEQDSSSGASGLSFQHCFVMGADLRLEAPVKTEKSISLHRFFDERPEIERRNAGLQSSESQDPPMPLPLPPLLDLNV